MEEEIIFKIEVPGAEKAVNSIENLVKANKALREERKKVDLDSAAGQARVKEINTSLDKNTEAIKNNSSALEKQRLNIGNYASALDGVAPGLSGFVTGMQGMIKSSLAFIATPIGAVIGALGLAIGALRAYFKGSEEGQNNLNKVVAVGSALFEQLMNVVEAAGKVIFDAISNPKQAIIDFANLIKENIINRFEGILELIPALGKSIGLLFKGQFVEAGKVAFDAVAKITTGVEDASKKIQGLIDDTIEMVNTGIKAGQDLAAFQARIDKDERALVVERAKVSLEVSKLRAEAITQEGDVKKATIEEAIKLEEQLSNKEVALANVRLANAELLRDANGDDKAALDEVAKATAMVASAEEARFTNTLKLRKELDALNEAEGERIQAEMDAEVEREKQAEEKRTKLLSDSFEKFNEGLEKNKKAKDKASKEETLREKNELNEKKKAFESLNSIVKQQTIAGKSLAIGQATVNTYKGATEILTQKSTLPSPFDFITKAINFAATIASGLGAVKSISGVGFARGGMLGEILSGPSHANGGIPFSIGGRLGFEAEGGEAIINKRSTQMFRSQLSAMNQAGGGRAFAVGGITNEVARASEAASSQREIFDAVSKIRPVVSVEDINVGQSNVEVIESRAQVV